MVVCRVSVRRTRDASSLPASATGTWRAAGFLTRCSRRLATLLHLLLLREGVERNPGPINTQGPAVSANNCPKTRGLQVLQLNINGWRGKKANLEKLIEEHKVDIVALQETLLSDSSIVPKFKGFTSIRQDRRIRRDGGRGHSGGLAFLIRNGLKHEPLGGIPDLPANAALESQGLRMWVDAKPRSPPISFWNLYRPPTRGGGDNRDGALITATDGHRVRIPFCSET